MTTILLLRNGYAHWFQSQRGKLQRQFSERLSDTQANLTTTGCPWLRTRNHPVHLVVDSPFEETDLVPLLSSGSRLSYWLDRRALLSRLRKQPAQHNVTWCELRPGEGAAVVNQGHWPEAWRAWLQHIQADRVTLVSLQSASSVLAASQQQDCLLIMSDAAETRHILCRRGLACFTRATPPAAADEELQSVQDTLQHLDSRSLLPDTVSLVTVGLAPARLKHLAALSAVHTVVAMETSGTGKALDDGQATQLVASHSDAAPPLAAKLCQHIVLLCAQRVGQLWWWPLSMHAGTDPVLDKLRQRHTLYQLYVGTVLTGLVAIYTVIFAISQGLDSARQRQAQALLQQQLRTSIVEQQEAAEQMHTQPIVAAASISRAHSLHTASGPRPVALLSAMADAYSAFPMLQLNTLSWVSVDETSELMDASFQSASNAPLRQVMPEAENTASGLQVSLVGSVSTTLPLRERQQRFHEFVEHLRASVLVQRVLIDLSPVDTLAGTVVQTDADAGDIGPHLSDTSQAVDYRLRLLIRAGSS